MREQDEAGTSKICRLGRHLARSSTTTGSGGPRARKREVLRITRRQDRIAQARMERREVVGKGCDKLTSIPDLASPRLPTDVVKQGVP